MSSRSRGSCSTTTRLITVVVLLTLCRGSHQIAKNFVNSSTPDLRPTFVVNFDTSTVICQHSSDPTDLHLHNMSSLCDGKQDCFVNPAIHDEVFPYCEHKCESTCSGRGACLYDGLKPQCYCDAGYSGAACELRDENECLEHPCHMMAQCQNTLGSYECRCLPGYVGNGHECTDIDECAESPATRCPEHSKCINLPGTHYCNCTQGFTPKGNQGSSLDKCVDVNECETGAHNCESNEMCENTVGSFKCVTKCSPGYELIGGKCEDVDECSSGSLHKCDVRAECINTVGGYECECEEGFSGDGKNCLPKSSCRKNSAICDRHASCHVVLDICDCKTGYTGDGITCHDVNECDAKENPCSNGGRCLNLDGGYVCCKDGQDDSACIKDQGAFCSGGCGDNAICLNGTCSCIDGYRGDPLKKCADVNECMESDSICGGVGDRCVNLFGGYKCCQHGSTDTECTDQAFSSDSSTVVSNHAADFTTTGEQIIEGSGAIQTSSGGSISVTRGVIPKDVELTTSGRLSCTSYCPPNSECVGGYCECVSGYGGNPLVGCEDIDECITVTCDLEANEWCVNLIGGFVCCNPANATHDDCIGLEITKEKGLHIIGGNEEDTIVATRSNHSTSDQLITQVVQQSRNFSTGQIILTRGKVLNGEAVTQTTDADEFGLEIAAADLSGSGSGITLPATLKPRVEGSGKKAAEGVWTEEDDGEDDDLMEEGSGGSWTTRINGTGFTGSPRTEGTITVRITTLGEDGAVESATKAGVIVPERPGLAVKNEKESTSSETSGSGKAVGEAGELGTKSSEASGTSSGPNTNASGESGSSGSTGNTSSQRSTGSGSVPASEKESRNKSGDKIRSDEKNGEETSSGSVTASKESSGDVTSPETPLDGSSTSLPEGSGDGEWIVTGSKGHFESGSKITVVNGKQPSAHGNKEPKGSENQPEITTDGEEALSTSSGDKGKETNPKITTDGEDSSSQTSAGEKGAKGDSKGKPTTEDQDSRLKKPKDGPLKPVNQTELPGDGSGILTTSSGGKNATIEHGSKLEKVTGSPTAVDSRTSSENPQLGLEISAGKKPGASNEVGLEIVWQSTTSPTTTPDSDNVGLEISGTDLKSTGKPLIEGSGTGDEEITATTRDVSKSTKKPRVEVDGGGHVETSGVDANNVKPTSIVVTTPSSVVTSSEAIPETGSGEPGIPDGTEGSGESTTSASEVTSPTSSAPPAPEASTTSAAAIASSTIEGSGELSTSTSAAETTTSFEAVPTTPEDSEKPTSATKEASVELSTSSAPTAQPATVVPPQSREEKKPEPTKDTFALPTTTTSTPKVNETVVENTKCTSSDECGMDALCERRTGVCRCEPGFEGAPPRKPCIDVDECATGDHKCHVTARCQNYIGGYACFCPTGFRKAEDGSCEDIDECAEHNSTCCGANARCVNKPGTYSCECEHGFLGDGYHCVENTKKPCDSVQSSKSHCAESNMSCEVDTSDGSVECKQCMSGYRKTGTVCEDIDECAAAKSPCSSHAKCVNLNGTFSCTCEAGFRGDGFMCTDINECDEERHPCHPHAECTNLDGSFKCECHSGFEGDGIKKCTNPLERSCEDVEKFCGRVEHVSCLSARIYNGQLSSVCECEPGFRYEKESNSCVDIDECEENRNNCDPASAVCVNTEGSFKCECAEGYEGEGGICTDIDECDRGNAGCDTMAMCINRMGSCGCKCMPGYTGDGAHCTRIEERTSAETACTDEWSRLCELEKKQCTVDEEEVPQCGACLSGYHPINGTCQSLQISGLCAQKNDCNKHAVCIDIHPDSHFCSCPDGFIGDGMICDDVDECNNAGMCEDENSKCENTIGSFSCVCLEGFKRLDDKCVVDEKKQSNRGKIVIDEEDSSSTNSGAEKKPTSQGTVPTTSPTPEITSSPAPDVTTISRSTSGSTPSSESPENVTLSSKSLEVSTTVPQSSTQKTSENVTLSKAVEPATKGSSGSVTSTLKPKEVTSSESTVKPSTTKASEITKAETTSESPRATVTDSFETSTLAPEKTTVKPSSVLPEQTTSPGKAEPSTVVSSKTTSAGKEPSSSSEAPEATTLLSRESSSPETEESTTSQARTSESTSQATEPPIKSSSVLLESSTVPLESSSTTTTSLKTTVTSPKPSESSISSKPEEIIQGTSSEAPRVTSLAPETSESTTVSTTVPLKSSSLSPLLESTTVPSVSSRTTTSSEKITVTSPMPSESSTSSEPEEIIQGTSSEAPRVTSPASESSESTTVSTTVPLKSSSSSPLLESSTVPSKSSKTTTTSAKISVTSPEPSETVSSSKPEEVTKGTSSEAPRVTSPASESSVLTTVSTTVSTTVPVKSSSSPELLESSTISSESSKTTTTSVKITVTSSKPSETVSSSKPEKVTQGTSSESPRVTSPAFETSESTTLSTTVPVKSSSSPELLESSTVPSESSRTTTTSLKTTFTSPKPSESSTSSEPEEITQGTSSEAPRVTSPASGSSVPTTVSTTVPLTSSSSSPLLESSTVPSASSKTTTSSEKITVTSQKPSESSTSSEPEEVTQGTSSESPRVTSPAPESPESTTLSTTVPVKSSSSSPLLESTTVPSESPRTTTKSVKITVTSSTPSETVSSSKPEEVTKGTSSEAPRVTSPAPETSESTTVSTIVSTTVPVKSSSSPELLEPSTVPSESLRTTTSSVKITVTSPKPSETVSSSKTEEVTKGTSSEAPRVTSPAPETSESTTVSTTVPLTSSSSSPLLESSTVPSEWPRTTTTSEKITVTSPKPSESSTSSEPEEVTQESTTPSTTAFETTTTSSAEGTTSESLILTAASSSSPETTSKATSQASVETTSKSSSEAPSSGKSSSLSPDDVTSSGTVKPFSTTLSPVTESVMHSSKLSESVTVSSTLSSAENTTEAPSPTTIAGTSSTTLNPTASPHSSTESSRKTSPEGSPKVTSKLVTLPLPESSTSSSSLSESSTVPSITPTTVTTPRKLPSKSPSTLSATSTVPSETVTLTTEPSSPKASVSRGISTMSSGTSEKKTTAPTSTPKTSTTAPEEPEVSITDEPVKPEFTPVVTTAPSVPFSSTSRVRLLTGSPDHHTAVTALPREQNRHNENSESATSPSPPTTIAVAKVSTGNRGPPSIQPPTATLTTPTNNGGYGEETNLEEEQASSTTTTSTSAAAATTTTSPSTTTEAPSRCSTVTCHSLASCEPATGLCICRDGFIGDGTTSCSKKSAADCVSLPSLCADNARCDHSTRSCECDAGYIGDGYVCAPHPQDCVLRDNLCSPEAICQNRRCQCLPGFTGDGVKCVSIHERASNCSQCDDNAHCVGGSTCKCNPGYFGNGLCCVPDPLDCVHFTGICHPNAVCNSETRQCECSSGFSGNGVSCFPQKSCRTDKSVCAKNAICLPTGSCICRHGFKGDPFYKCTSIVDKEPVNQHDLSDVSSCATPCDGATQLCISGECICKPGFRRNSTLGGADVCADINECAEKTHRCDRVATCRNTFGSHVCTCPVGHVGDGITCVPHVNQGKLSVYCEADGMTLVLGNETSDFEGKIFVKGQAENPYCSKSFSSLVNSHKPYVFKVAFQHCDVQLLDNHTMASTVVVQKHAMFLTNKADSYDLRCQYPVGSRAVESHVNVSELATTSTLTDKNSTIAPVCRLSVSNDHQSSISSAMVGDTLKLALEVTPAESFGILPRNCFAVNIESGERYTLTDDMGCAIDESLFPQWSLSSPSKTQAVFRTFKWPDSSMIRFQCDCNPCVGQCPTPSCIGSTRFRRHQTIAPIVNDGIRHEMVLMSGVESLAVSSIINVHDSHDLNSSEDQEEEITKARVANMLSESKSICVKMAPLLIATGSFAVCLAILLYLCSKKPKTIDLESEMRF